PRRPPKAALLPYTTLFRSEPDGGDHVFDFGGSALERALARHPDPRWSAVAEILDEYLGIMSMPGYGGVDSATVLALAAFEIFREPAEVTVGGTGRFAPARRR